jgi:hypothetical protein
MCASYDLGYVDLGQVDLMVARVARLGWKVGGRPSH